MRGLGALLAAAVMAVAVNDAQAAVRIAGDPGGQIGTYVRQFETIRSRGEAVVIDGSCYSACTLVLGFVPRERICVTSRATLGFHAAWRPDDDGRPVTSEAGTRYLLSMYPANVRHWISKRGGLTPHMIYLRGRELAAMYPRCDD